MLPTAVNKQTYLVIAPTLVQCAHVVCHMLDRPEYAPTRGFVDPISPFAMTLRKHVEQIGVLVKHYVPLADLSNLIATYASYRELYQEDSRVSKLAWQGTPRPDGVWQMPSTRSWPNSWRVCEQAAARYYVYGALITPPDWEVFLSAWRTTAATHFFAMTTDLSHLHPNEYVSVDYFIIARALCHDMRRFDDFLWLQLRLNEKQARTPPNLVSNFVQLRVCSYSVRS